MTERTIEERFKEHCYDYKRRSFEKRPLYAAMKKYGTEHFHVELIEETNNPEEREKYWIKKLNTIRPNGYNIASGGEGGNGTHANNLKNWRERNPDKVQENIKKLLKWQKTHPEEMQQVKEKIQQWRKQHPENTKAANEASKKRVKCIETGIIYESASEASQAIGGKTSAHIGQVCNGKRKTAYKCHWEWVERTEK